MRPAFAYTMARGIKLIENRSRRLGESDQNVWMAVAMSQINEPNIPEIRTHLQHDDRLKALSDESINKDIVAHSKKLMCFAKFGASLSSLEAKRLDKVYTDYPKPTKAHWPVLDLVKVPIERRFEISGNTFPVPLSDDENKRVQSLLKQLLAKRS